MAFYDEWEDKEGKNIMGYPIEKNLSSTTENYPSQTEPSFESRQPSRTEPTTEETIEGIKQGAERLGEAGSNAVKALRTIFEQMKDKIKRKDVDKLEAEITKLEDEKKMSLEKIGLTKQKLKLEKELAEIKSRKLNKII